MVNEVALGLLFALVGWEVALTYLAFGLSVAIVGRFVIGKLKLEGWLEPWVREIRAGVLKLPDEQITIVDRLKASVEAVTDIAGRVWVWLIAGIAAGASIHGYVPAERMVRIMGADAWRSASCSTRCSTDRGEIS